MEIDGITLPPAVRRILDVLFLVIQIPVLLIVGLIVAVLIVLDYVL